MWNSFKTTILLTGLAGLLLAIGHFFGGTQGMVIALVFAVAMNVFSYWYSDKIVLAVHRCQPLTREQAPGVYRVVEELAARAQIPMPKVYLMPTDVPNAFATGRSPKHAAIAVTRGLLTLMNEEELKGVLGHELAHVLHRDILVSTVAATIASAVLFLANMAKWAAIFGGLSRDDRDGGNILGLLGMALLAPFAAMLIQMAISRSREYKADEGGAALTGDPRALAAALTKLERAGRRAAMPTSPQYQHLYFTGGGGGFLAQLFSTHPPIPKRVERLRRLTADETWRQ